MTTSTNNNSIDCFIAVFDNNTYIIPVKLRDVFDTTHPEDRPNDFNCYILPPEGIMEGVHIDHLDFSVLIEGMY